MFQNATLDPLSPASPQLLQLVYLQVVSSISSQMARSLHASTGSERAGPNAQAPTRRPPGAFLPGLRHPRSCMRPTLRLENPIDTPRTLSARRSSASFPGAGGFGWLLAVLGSLAAPGSGAAAAAAAEPLLEGRVLLSSGPPVAGARVRLFVQGDLGRSLRATADESGYFAFPLNALRKAAPSAGAPAPGSELPQPVQSLDDHPVPAASPGAGAPGGIQHPGSAGGDPGGRGTAGRFSHGGLERDRRLGARRGLGGVFVPASWGRGASDAVDGAAGRPGGLGGWSGFGRGGRHGGTSCGKGYGSLGRGGGFDG